MKALKPGQKGFTIVELLIVIVVIAILAAIAIVAFSGVQERARDTQRRSDLASIARALQVYEVDNGDYIQGGSGCGINGNGSGWFNSEYYTGYDSIVGCLVESGALERPLVDPSGATSCSAAGCRAYMKYSCSSGTYLYASLESEPVGDGLTDGTCAANADEMYGMNYVVKVD